MYEQSAKLNMYYRELDPGRREEMLREILMEVPDDGGHLVREFLFRKRYKDEKKPGAWVDRGLWLCVSFTQLYGATLFKGKARRDVQKELAQVGYEEALSYGEAGEKALYWELRNASLRYFKTSEDPSYRKQVFGMSSQTNTVDQLCLDAWKMSLGLSQKLGLSGKLRVWNQAVRDSFSLAVPNGEGLYAALAMKKGK